MTNTCEVPPVVDAAPASGPASGTDKGDTDDGYTSVETGIADEDDTGGGTGGEDDTEIFPGENPPRRALNLRSSSSGSIGLLTDTC